MREDRGMNLGKKGGREGKDWEEGGEGKLYLGHNI